MKPPKAHGQKHMLERFKRLRQGEMRVAKTGQNVERFTTENHKQNTRRVDKKLQGAALRLQSGLAPTDLNYLVPRFGFKKNKILVPRLLPQMHRHASQLCEDMYLSVEQMTRPLLVPLQCRHALQPADAIAARGRRRAAAENRARVRGCGCFIGSST